MCRQSDGEVTPRAVRTRRICNQASYYANKTNMQGVRCSVRTSAPSIVALAQRQAASPTLVAARPCPRRRLVRVARKTAVWSCVRALGARRGVSAAKDPQSCGAFPGDRP